MRLGWVHGHAPDVGLGKCDSPAEQLPLDPESRSRCITAAWHVLVCMEHPGGNRGRPEIKPGDLIVTKKKVGVRPCCPCT